MTSDLAIKLAYELIEEAKVDLQAARELLKQKFFHKAVFESQQCVEKAMKATLACEGLTQVYEHDVGALFAAEVITHAPQDWVEELRNVFRETAWLMEQYTATRYPAIKARTVVSPRKSYREDEAKDAIKTAESALNAIEKYIQQVVGKRNKST
ncbi:MAG: HEPN domain-containing protein [Candidatus Freyarchaeota archaeon]|nr:HEPN domain-containing protein [Candidatus Jordarchaeia archaeon]MBS7268808.1 HEPN domain-containing protein [Candidatus Jordarchaeia archaeon]MBS7279155.1 HEPN domain-containing protein [Candidatus Jordarchaeia archaeon]